jgi:hypothetical protein
MVAAEVETRRKEQEEEERKAAETRRKMEEELEEARQREEERRKESARQREEKRKEEARRKEQEEDNKPLVAGSPASAPASAGGVEDSGTEVSVTVFIGPKTVTCKMKTGSTLIDLKHALEETIGNMAQRPRGDYVAARMVLFDKTGYDAHQLIDLPNDTILTESTVMTLRLEHPTLMRQIRQARKDSEEAQPAPPGKRGRSGSEPPHRAKRARGGPELDPERLDPILCRVEKRGYIATVQEFEDMKKVQDYILQQKPDINRDYPATEQDLLFCFVSEAIETFAKQKAGRASSSSSFAATAPVSAGTPTSTASTAGTPLTTVREDLLEKLRQGGDIENDVEEREVTRARQALWSKKSYNQHNTTVNAEVDQRVKMLTDKLTAYRVRKRAGLLEKHFAAKSIIVERFRKAHSDAAAAFEEMALLDTDTVTAVTQMLQEDSET